ncbi:MAG: BamA/TamA family outer membrane protein [Candidatus Binatia bacterium]
MRKLLGALALGACLSASVAEAGFSIVPIPEILTDPNEGNTYGFLPVILLLDRSGRLEHIIADDIRYNKITGWFASFRLFGYPTLDQRYYLTLRKSEHIDQDFIGEYEREGMFDGTTEILVNFTYFRDSRLRFFGFGNDSPEEQETNYTQSKFASRLRIGYRPLTNIEVAWQTRVERASIQRGGVPDVPFTAEFFGDLDGLEPTTIHGQTFSIAYDDRDSQTITTTGTLGAARVEIVDRTLGSSQSYVKYGFELRRFIPFHDRFVLAIHGVLDYLSGAERAPFYERSSIGGVKSLRGFGTDRFIDAHRFFGTVELRTRAFRRQLFEVMTELEVAPFIDAGEVFSSMDTFPLDSLHYVGGVGFRGVVRPQVVGFVDIGYGSDGAAVFTGLDYPF